MFYLTDFEQVKVEQHFCTPRSVTTPLAVRAAEAPPLAGVGALAIHVERLPSG